MKNRTGKFKVTTNILCDTLHYTNLFKGVVVLDVHHDHTKAVSTYIAASSHFDEIDHESSEIVPEYMAIFTKGNPDPTWKRISIDYVGF